MKKRRKEQVKRFETRFYDDDDDATQVSSIVSVFHCWQYTLFEHTEKWTYIHISQAKETGKKQGKRSKRKLALFLYTYSFGSGLAVNYGCNSHPTSNMLTLHIPRIEAASASLKYRSLTEYFTIFTISSRYNIHNEIHTFCFLFVLFLACMTCLACSTCQTM